MLRYKDVRRLDVAVNNPFSMRGIQRIGDLDAERHHGFDVQRFPGYSMLQRQAFQILHNDEGLVTVFADFVDRADVGVVECRRCAGFTSETF